MLGVVPGTWSPPGRAGGAGRNGHRLLQAPPALRGAGPLSVCPWAQLTVSPALDRRGLRYTLGSASGPDPVSHGCNCQALPPARVRYLGELEGALGSRAQPRWAQL